MRKVLLVEDESSVVSFVLRGLTEAGYAVTVALDGNQGLQMALTGDYHMIILDIMLPGMNGLEVCKQIRKQNRKVAILMLTALGTAENVVLGLETGADDYLVKPFKFIELLARIKTLLRRSESGVATEEDPDVYRFADVELNDTTKTVIRNGETITCTSTEYRLLLLLMKSPRKVFSRAEILEDVWGVNFEMNTNVVDVYVNYLRKKLEVNGLPRLIHTVIGMGYVLKNE
ncbi:response regulator transcription factor [Pseudochryseolinea flava]|uniref:DNA-binding response regulator n=1 Tax=Pseudochryseolinea flava TaxID=2059302 RepID=A0A364Y3R6_9BACT|nr:response regulator transcription factor [Pseudochryseolinea flava]RAW00659.1 DNA-binding response regulator [Pseudochryseolinea flava]